MNRNTLYILAALFVILVVIAYLITHEGGDRTSSYDIEGTQLFEIDSALVDKIEIEQQGKKLTLVKGAVEWKITEPIEYGAYQQFVDLMLSDLKNYKLSSIVSSNPEKKTKYGFIDTNGVKVSVYQGNELMGTFLVGNASSGASQTYIKNMEGDEIYLADGILRSNFVKGSLDEWRDKLIIAIPKGTVKSVEFITDEDSYKVIKDTTGKYYLGQDSINSGVFDGILNILQNCNTQRFKDTLISDDSKFDKSVKVDWGKITELNFLKSPDTLNVQYYLKVTDNKQIFEVDQNFISNLIKTRKDLTGK